MVEDLQNLARGLDNASVSRSDLSAALVRLAHGLRAHNRYEEEILGGLLVKVDAWGPARVELMNEHHAGEHRQLLAALFDAGSALETSGPENLSICLDRVLEHMAYEEKAILGDDVLRDDSVVADQVGG
jgi:hypothetical protein